MKAIPKHTLEFLDSWLEYRLLWSEVPGYQVTIAKDGKTIFSQAYGTADIETKQKLTTKHIFRIASHSKTFTATAIMQLAEKKKLRIDDEVVEYLGWLKRHKDARWKEVTIRQLMSHSAGIIRDGAKSDYWQLIEPFPNKKRLHESVLAAKLVLEPNIRLKYSNFGYALLGEIIEEVTGQTYGEYVNENIIKPLGLKNTFPEVQSGMRDKMSSGYSRLSLKHEFIKLSAGNTDALAPATGFCSTAEDMAVYFSAQRVGSKKLLSDVSKREMQRIQWNAYPEGEGSYGMGLEIDRFGDRDVLGHSGGFPGHVSRTMFDPRDGYVISILANSDNAEPGQMARGITAIIDGLGEQQPKKSLLKFEGLYADLGTVVHILVRGEELVLIWPNWWRPFDELEHLEYVDKNTLKIVKTNSYYSDGELIKFRFKKQKVEYIVNAGSTMFPSVTGEVPEQICNKLNSKN